jgi:thiol-disulfide isomerase/thioredoxin
MRVTISLIVLSLSVLGISAQAQAQTQPQVPDALLQPQGAQVPPALIPQPTNLLVHALTAKDADGAWKELNAASQRPQPPAEWETKEPTEKEQMDFFLPYVLALMDKAKDFYTRFPTNSHAADARKQEFDMTGVAVSMGATNQQSRLETEEKVLLADPALTEEDRFAIRQNDVERAAQSKESEGEAVMMAEYEKGVRALQKEFPKRPEIFQMLFELAEGADATKARGIIAEITNSAVASDETKQAATSQLWKLEAVGKPVDIHFTAQDGKDVDLGKLKGKVVLIDFWATWCAPCVGEIPHVKETYDKLHAKGFEIVGISLDREKDSLTEFVAGHHMEWPQYFDGQEWQNKFAAQFHIESIPAMWLVDKNGNLRDINARADLGGKVEKLLAE